MNIHDAVARDKAVFDLQREMIAAQAPIIWKVYKIASKAVWLGVVEPANEATAMEKAAAEFKVAANRLMALRR
jgi:hypothetical protein